MYLSKKVKMVLCVVLLMISIALAIGVIFWANNLDHNAYDYGELAYREFTVQSIKQSTGRNAHYEIYTNDDGYYEKKIDFKSSLSCFFCSNFIYPFKTA